MGRTRRPHRRPLRVRVLRCLAAALIAGVVLSLALVAPLRWLPPPTSAFILQSQWRSQAVDYRWVDWGRISPHAAIAVVAAEDQRFPDHWGLDTHEIRNAVQERIEYGRVRGASTITQQVAKNLYLWPGRSWLRKVLEAYLAVTIELLWPKRRILEVYLNVAQFGPGVYGVEAAARNYFGRPADRLTARQGALLAAVLPNPRALRVAAPSDYLRQRTDEVLRKVRRLGGPRYLGGLDAGARR